MEAAGMDSNEQLQNGGPVPVSGILCGNMSLGLLKLFIMALLLSVCSTFETTVEPSSPTNQTSKNDTIQILTVGTSSNSDTIKMMTTTERKTPTTTVVSSSKTVSVSAPSTSAVSITAVPARTLTKDDYILIEMIRLVFNGNVGTASFPNKVYGLLESFLTRAARELKTNDGSDWSYELSSTLQYVNFENATTYMDFRIKHTLQQGISFVFNRLKFGNFISQNSNLVFLAECWPSRNCQNSSMAVILQPSYFEENITMFSVVLVLCSLFLLVTLTGLVCSCLRRMKTSKTDNGVDMNTLSGPPQEVSAHRSSSHKDRVAKEVIVPEASFSACVVDDDDIDNIHSTWLIPLDQAPGRQTAVVVVTTVDTKL